MLCVCGCIKYAICSTPTKPITNFVLCFRDTRCVRAQCTRIRMQSQSLRAQPSVCACTSCELSCSLQLHTDNSKTPSTKPNRSHPRRSRSGHKPQAKTTIAQQPFASLRLWRRRRRWRRSSCELWQYAHKVFNWIYARTPLCVRRGWHSETAGKRAQRSKYGTTS